MRYRTDGEALFSIETTIDAAQAATDAYDKKNEKKKKKDGFTRYPVVVDANGNRRELGGLDRESYYTGQPLEQPAEDDSPLAGLIQRKRPEGGYDPREYGDGV
jgi:hypothetical protein